MNLNSCWDSDHRQGGLNHRGHIASRPVTACKAKQINLLCQHFLSCCHGVFWSGLGPDGANYFSLKTKLFSYILSHCPWIGADLEFRLKRQQLFKRPPGFGVCLRNCPQADRLLQHLSSVSSLQSNTSTHPCNGIDYQTKFHFLRLSDMTSEVARRARVHENVQHIYHVLHSTN